MTAWPPPPGTQPPPSSRQSLAARIALLSVAVAVLTATVAGLLAAGLVRHASDGRAQQTLATTADIAAAVADATPNTRAIENRLRVVLRDVNIRPGVITSDGTLDTGAVLVRGAVTSQDIAQILAGQPVSTIRTVDGVTVFVEARPTDSGGVVVVQRRSDALAQQEQTFRRMLFALVIAGAIAAVGGLLVAWRMARPLRRAADAAHALAAGQRDVALAVEGPREVAEVSAAVNTLSAALGRSEARQRQFLMSVSHDLRTPLTAVRGYAESLAGGVVPPEETAQVGTVLAGEAERLERLVADLLDLARLGAQDFRVEPVPVELTGLAREAAASWRPRTDAAQVRLVVALPGAAVAAWTDPIRLRQVLDGLFDNALRVTPAGAPIVLEVRGEPGTSVVELRDGGPGLTDDDLAVAFEQGALYERYRGVRRVGTGLGLAIVHGLVLRLHAQIAAGHAPEGGARFTVRLPAGPPAASATTRPLPSPASR